jgi:hypothetical protein
MKKYIIKKLIGQINPVGESHIDDERFENLKEMTELVDSLLFDIEQVALINKGRPEHSRDKAGKYAAFFMEDVHSSREW